MELLYTFAELTPDPVTRRTISPALRLRNLIEEATLADEVGLDVFAIGAEVKRRGTEGQRPGRGPRSDRGDIDGRLRWASPGFVSYGT